MENAVKNHPELIALKYVRWAANVFIISIGLVCFFGKFPVALGIDLNHWYVASVFIGIGLLGFLGVNVYYGGPLDKRRDVEWMNKMQQSPAVIQTASVHTSNPAKRQMELLEHVRNNPPFFIKDIAKPIDHAWESESWDSDFAVVCACNSETFNLQGIPERDFWTDPFAIKCVNCETERLLFDAKLHPGLNRLPNVANEAPHATVTCPKCKHGAMRLMVTFQYSLDADEYIRNEQPNLKFEELYHWFILNATCDACKHKETVAEVRIA